MMGKEFFRSYVNSAAALRMTNVHITHQYYGFFSFGFALDHGAKAPFRFVRDQFK